VTATQWATYQYTSNQWLLQGWEIAEDGSVSKIAETQVDLWSGNFSNPNWRLVEHPDGGVALIALRGTGQDSSDAIEMSRYGVRNNQFELIATFEIPLQAPGWDLMYVAKDYAYFINQRATYQSLVAPWEIRSLRDLSLVASGDSIHSAIATDNRVSKFPYYTVGNTFWFGIDNTTGRLPSKGLKVQQDGTLAVVDQQGADHALDVDGYYDRFVNRGLAHFPRRDRWAVFGQSLSQVNDVGVWQYELTLLDENGNTVFVQFPVLDSTYYMDAYGGRPRVGIRVGQVFFDAPVNGTQRAHWFGYAVSVSNNVYTPHRFSGSFTIPNVVDGSAVITTTWQDLGAAGSQHGSYYDPDPPSASREGMVTSSSAMIFNSEDDTFDNYNYNLTAWYHMTRDGTYTRLETVDDGYYSKGWGGHTISTMSSVTFPAVPVETIIAPGLTGELLDAGQRFLRGDR
jgi:hypothetical protein